jgi:hypothetical protein
MTDTIVLPGIEGDEEYALFGKILLRWGYIETRLTNIVGRLTHERFKFPNANGVPRDFGAKIKLAKRGYKKIDAMASLYEEAKALLDPLPKLHYKRVVIVHGSYQGRVPKGYVFQFFNSENGKQQKMSIEICYLSKADLDTLLEDMMKADAALSELSEKTFSIPFPVLLER